MAERKLKFALMISSLSRGGSERVMVNLAQYLLSQGHAVTIVTQYAKEDEYPLPEGACRVISEITEEESGGRIHNFLARFRKLRGIWKSEQPDVILSFIGKNNLMTILTSRMLPAAVAVAVRGEPSEEYYSKGMMTAANILFPFADGVILQTNASRHYFLNAAVRRSVILRNPISEAFLLPELEGEREKEVVMVGRVDGNKNQEMAIRAFANIAEDFPGHTLTIYGEGDHRATLLELVEELGMSERIVLPGASQDIPNRIRKAELFLLTSYSEGVPNTIIEAMALGIPVISTNCPSGGPAELITAGQNGLLIPVGDTASLVLAMRTLLSDPDRMKRMGKDAREVGRSFAGEVVNREWEEYLTGLVR